QPLTAQRLVEEAEKTELPDAHVGLVEAMRGRWVIGGHAEDRTRLRELATAYGVDEVMVNPVAGAYMGTEPASAPARDETLRLLSAG
ncbi:MAG: LLM class flavin-dependent oxidoreductase, partial [Nocardioides sp.]